MQDVLPVLMTPRAASRQRLYGDLTMSMRGSKRPLMKPHLLVSTGTAPCVELLEALRGPQLLNREWVAMQGQPGQ